MSAAGTEVEKRLSRVQASRKLKVTDETIRRWVAQGKMREERYPAGEREWVRYTLSEVERIKALRDAEVPLPVVADVTEN